MPFGAEAVDFVREAERLGVEAVWVPGVWAFDALTPLGVLAASTSTAWRASARPTGGGRGGRPEGGLGTCFSREPAGFFFGPLRGGAAGAGRELWELAGPVAVGVELTDDVGGAARRHAEGYAFTFG